MAEPTEPRHPNWPSTYAQYSLPKRRTWLFSAHIEPPWSDVPDELPEGIDYLVYVYEKYPEQFGWEYEVVTGYLQCEEPESPERVKEMMGWRSTMQTTVKAPPANRMMPFIMRNDIWARARNEQLRLYEYGTIDQYGHDEDPIPANNTR